MPQERDERWWRRMSATVGGLLGSTLASSGRDERKAKPAASQSGGLDPGDALMAACTRGDSGEAERLLRDGADPCFRGEFGANPLTRAAEQGHVALVSLLLSNGGRHDAQDDNGDTALLCACRMGHADVARVLLAAGADPGVSNKQGNNSLDAALEARNVLGRPEVSELLLGHRTGDNPLEAAPRVAPPREEVLGATGGAGGSSLATLTAPGGSGGGGGAAVGDGGSGCGGGGGGAGAGGVVAPRSNSALGRPHGCRSDTLSSLAAAGGGTPVAKQARAPHSSPAAVPSTTAPIGLEVSAPRCALAALRPLPFPPSPPCSTS